MHFKTDGGGLAKECEIKVSMALQTASTWNTRLSQIGRTRSEVIICTYSLPDKNYVDQIIGKRPDGFGIVLLVNSNFIKSVSRLKKKFPELRVFIASNTHAKIVLCGKDTVWLSSANFGHSGWLENTIRIKDREVYIFYHDKVMEFIRKNAKKIRTVDRN